MPLTRLDRINEADIRNGYDLGTTELAKTGWQCYLVAINDSYGEALPPGVIYHIEIADAAMKSLLDKSKSEYIVRYLIPRKKLWHPYCISNETKIGRVVFNAYFFLLEAYRNKKIAKTVYLLEEEIYKKWGAEEVHMTAAEDGKYVWRSRGFVLHCDDTGNVEKMYKEWCTENGVEYAELKDITKYPVEFLQSDWVRHFRMYKVIKV